MSENPQAQHKQGKRKKALGIFVFVLLVVAVLSSLYWLFFVRNYQETEDAYVGGNQVMISAQVNGNIQQINADNMDFVRAGDLLLSLDDTDAKLAFTQAQNNLASAVRQIRQLGYSLKQLEAVVQAKQATLSRAQGDLARREQLARSGAIDKESLQHARDAFAIAQADLEASKNQLSANQALLMQGDLMQQPEVQKASSALKQAWLNLKRTQILSPIDGYVARRSAQVGQKVAVGSPLMAVIASDNMWIDANFKETQLKNMRIGQPVEIYFDLYGKDIKFEGKVQGIDMGTGSAFSLLPAQNATGNWIKVVQRVPVRIALDPEQVAKYPLRIGLSAKVEVNVANTEGEVLKPQKGLEPLYQTQSLQYEQTEIDQLIQQIVQENQ